MSDDRLPLIKANGVDRSAGDVLWLIHEVERLRALNDIQYVRLAHMEYVAKENVRLRAQLDSVEVETWCVSCAHSKAKQQMAEDTLKQIDDIANLPANAVVDRVGRIRRVLAAVATPEVAS